MLYKIKGKRYGDVTIYESKSRNARRHLISNDFNAVSVFDKNGNLISHAEKYADMIIFGAVRKN